MKYVQAIFAAALIAGFCTAAMADTLSPAARLAAQRRQHAKCYMQMHGQCLKPHHETAVPLPHHQTWMGAPHS